MDAVEADEFQAAEEFDVSMAVLDNDTCASPGGIYSPRVRSAASFHTMVRRRVVHELVTTCVQCVSMWR